MSVAGGWRRVREKCLVVIIVQLLLRDTQISDRVSLETVRGSWGSDVGPDCLVGYQEFRLIVLIRTT